MNQTYNELLRSVTEDYLESLDLSNLPLATTIEREILESVNLEVARYNKGAEDPPGSGEFPYPKKGKEKYEILKTLTHSQIGMILIALHHAKRIYYGKVNDAEGGVIGFYATEGSRRGIYDVCPPDVASLVRSYHVSASKQFIGEVLDYLSSEAPKAARCSDKDLVAVNNGIYNYRTKELLPFSPEWIFTSKSGVNFVDNAQNVVIHNEDDGTDWNVESWMKTLSDDPEIINLLWALLGAVIRPNVPWNKAAWLYSPSGNNGKGTLCRLMRNLCGDEAHTSIAIGDFGKDFMLEPLTYASAIIVDENDTNTFIDKAAALKSVITGDPFQINRKFKQAVTMRFQGMMVQCVNELPRSKDRSDSAYRRILPIPMTKRFEGHERKYIKDDYLNRKDVLEYVMYKLLAQTNYYELSQPKACLELLEEYKVTNDPVRQFMADTLPEVVWTLLPRQFYYDLYVGWNHRNNSEGKPMKKDAFLNNVKRILSEYPGWIYGNKKVRPGGRMDMPEPLILEYNVTPWMNKSYTGTDPDKKCMPDLAESYRGLEFIGVRVAKSNDEEDKED